MFILEIWKHYRKYNTEGQNPDLSFPLPPGNHLFPFIFGNLYGKVELSQTQWGKMVLIEIGLHPTILEISEEREYTFFLCDSSELLLYGSLIGLTWVFACPRGNLCGQSVGMHCVARIASCFYPGVGCSRRYSFKPRLLRVGGM